MRLKVIQFLTLVLYTLALVSAGAHFFALPNKIDLAQQTYFIVQRIYRGWALFGFVLFPALAASLVLTVMLRRERAAFWLALAAFLCLAAGLAIFFHWTFPANQATDNWTTVPADWQALRRQWEYSHAANAILTFVGLCCAILSTLVARR